MGRHLPTFNGFIGQRAEVNRLAKLIAGAKAHGEAFPHTGFFGPSGCGKTALATAVAREFETVLHLSNGNDSIPNLVAKLGNVKTGDFLLVDESQGLGTSQQELLYDVMDTSQIPGWALAHSKMKGETKLPEAQAIPRCTVIVATDQPGKLQNAIRRRLQVTVKLGFYQKREMQQIVNRMASDMKVLLKPQARNQLARVSCGLPRRAKQLLGNLRLQFPQALTETVGLEEVRQFLRECGIDHHGLGAMDRKYLLRLGQLGTASLETLALHVGYDSAYASQDIEGLLHRRGLLMIGPGGRKLTERGKAYVARINEYRKKRKDERKNARNKSGEAADKSD